MWKVAAVLALLAALPCEAKRLHSERWYQEKHCKGQIEHRLPDRTRVDCLTDTHAIEYDFANKWHSAIGQALHYAFQTNKRAGIALILEKPKDIKYWYMLNSLIEHYELPVDVWKVTQSSIH